MMLLKDLPTGQRFATSDGTYMRCNPTNWDVLRDNPNHWLHGINPQIAVRTDAIYVMQVEPDRGVLSLMPPDVMVEPVPEPTPASEYAYRVTVEIGYMRDTYNVGTLPGVQRLIRAAGRTFTDLRVAIEHAGTHINADGSLCREQGRGLQFRAVESKVQIGSISL